MKTVLVVDDDLGFLFWLGKTLENARYNVVPAASIPEAHSLLSVLMLAPDLLIINPALSDSGEFIGVLRRDWPRVRVVAAMEEGMAEASRIPVGADRWGRKPPGLIIAQSATLKPTGANQFVAFPGNLLFGRVARWIGAKPAVMVSLLIWTGVLVAMYVC